MSDFSIRADSVDVEQIMRQIRARIRDKRGVDYTEEQIRELATAKLERFLDPSGVRSGLLEEFRRRPPAPPAPNYEFEDTTLFQSDKPLVRFVRSLLRPLLKLFFNPNVLTSVLHTQAAFNRWAIDQQQDARHDLYFEVMHNLVLEMTRVSIEAKNLRMRVESLQSRLEFNERRARALEAVVQYKPESVRAGRPDESAREQPGTEPQGGVDPITGGDSLRTRRRRRRRGRRAGASPGSPEATGTGAAQAGAADVDGDMDEGGPGDEEGGDAPPSRAEATPPESPAPAASGAPEAAPPSDPSDAQ
jgi:hypothetical protein